MVLVILVRKAVILKGKVVNLKDRYIIKCFGPDETKYYLQDVGANILSTDPNKAIFYKNKDNAQSLCDTYNIYVLHVKYNTLNGEIIPKNWSLDVIKSYIEEG